MERVELALFSLNLSLPEFAGYAIIKCLTKGISFDLETDLKTMWDNTVFENIHII